MKKIGLLLLILLINSKIYTQAEASPVEFYVTTQNIYFGNDPNQSDKDQFTRKIEIYRGSQSRVVEGERPFYHKPVLAFKRNPNPINGLPNIIFSVDSEANTKGLIEVKFYVILSSDKFLNVCAQTVGKKLNLSKVLIRPWPIKQMVVQCYRNNELLAELYTKSLAGMYHTIPFTLEFTQEKFQRFLRYFDQLSFVFKYTYSNKREYALSTNLDSTEAIQLAINRTLSSQQKESHAPIFQKEERDLRQSISQSISRTSRIEHPDLLPLLNNMHANTMLNLLTRKKTIYIDDLTATDPVRISLVKYLKPLLRKTLETEGVSRSKIRSTIISGGGNGSVGLKLGPLSLGANGESKIIKKIEDVTGTKWEKSTSNETYYPHTVKVSYLAGGYATKKFKFNYKNFLSVGTSNKYIETSPIPVFFTDDKLNNVYRGEREQENYLMKLQAELRSTNDRIRKVAEHVDALKVSQNTVMNQLSKKIIDLRNQINLHKNEFSRLSTYPVRMGHISRSSRDRSGIQYSLQFTVYNIFGNKIGDSSDFTCSNDRYNLSGGSWYCRVSNKYDARAKFTYKKNPTIIYLVGY